MMMIVSYLPYMVYYGQKFFKTNNIVIVKDADSETLIGDACYVNALIKRSVDSNNEKKAPPPPNMELSHNNYLLSKSQLVNHLIISEEFNFKTYMISIKETFLDTDIPPPKNLL